MTNGPPNDADDAATHLAALTLDSTPQVAGYEDVLQSLHELIGMVHECAQLNNTNRCSVAPPSR